MVTHYVDGAMPLNEGGPWDFFLSHKQAECGRAAALACRDLEKEGKRVWLDVNMDNCDTDAMLEGVENAHNFVLVLSDGYFSSKFCAMELRYALKLGKPIILCHAEGMNVGAALQAAPDEFANVGKHTSIQLIVSDPQFRRLSVEKIIKKSAEPVEAQMQRVSIEVPRPEPARPSVLSRPAAFSPPPQMPPSPWPKPAKPSDQAISRLFAKVGADGLESALKACTLKWKNSGLDNEDAKVVAYVITFSASLNTLR